jgi:hypothetical protein
MLSVNGLCDPVIGGTATGNSFCSSVISRRDGSVRLDPLVSLGTLTDLILEWARTPERSEVAAGSFPLHMRYH